MSLSVNANGMWVTKPAGGGWSPHLMAAAIAAAVHALVPALMLAGWEVGAPPAAPRIMTMTTELVALAPPVVVEVDAVAVPELSAALPPATPEQPGPEPALPLERPKPAPVDPDAIALQRKEELRQKERERQRARQIRRQEERRLAQEQGRTEQARRNESARQAEAARQAESAQRAASERLAAAQQAFDSRRYFPIEKIAPAYPRRALDKSLQGDCTVSYTVTAEGRVRDPRVVGDCHPVFIQPSLQAAKAFRYQPRLVNGVAVAVPEVRNTFHYRIQ